jgi:hypothetical protein
MVTVNFVLPASLDVKLTAAAQKKYDKAKKEGLMQYPFYQIEKCLIQIYIVTAKICLYFPPQLKKKKENLCHTKTKKDNKKQKKLITS